MKKLIIILLGSVALVTTIAASTQSGQVYDFCPNSSNPNVCYRMDVINQLGCDLEFYFEYGGPCGDIVPAWDAAGGNNIVTSGGGIKTFNAYEIKYPLCDGDPCRCPDRFYVTESPAGPSMLDPWGPLGATTTYPWTITYTGFSLCSNPNVSCEVTYHTPSHSSFRFY